MTDKELRAKAWEKPFKRYWLFANVQYYAAGGMCDLAGTFDTVAEAVDVYRAGVKEYFWEWCQVFDGERRIVVLETEQPSYGGDSVLHPTGSIVKN